MIIDSHFEPKGYLINDKQIKIIIKFGTAKSMNTYLEAKDFNPTQTNFKPKIRVY